MNFITEHSKHKGFTLIEMSVVIIIIGLIIGGIISSKNLIIASDVNAVISQMTQYQVAARSFKLKYDQHPGDFSEASIVIDSSLSNGNGDGRILGGVAFDSVTLANGEPTEFWNHLSKAGMIGDQITQLDPTTDTTVATLGVHFPRNKTKKGGISTVTSGSTNIWYLGTDTSFYTNINKGLTSNLAYIIDSKLDDEMPGTGNVTYASHIHRNKYYDSALYDPPIDGWTTKCTEEGNGDNNVDPTENYYINSNRHICALIIKNEL